MYLQKDMSFNGVTISPCYIVVGAISISADRSKMSFIAEYKAGIEADEYHTDCFTCEYYLDGGNPEAQAYAYLKKLDAFRDATES